MTEEERSWIQWNRSQDRRQILNRAKRIVAILHLDGHVVDGSFMPKETALKAKGEAQPFSVFFYNKARPHHTLSRQDQRTAEFIEDHVHDIPYWKYWFGMLDPTALDRILKTVRKPEFEDNPFAWIEDRDVWYVAYKDGHHEKDVLEKLDISSFNLEDLRCPKAEDIQIQREHLNCGFHTNLKTHCSAYNTKNVRRMA